MSSLQRVLSCNSLVEHRGNLKKKKRKKYVRRGTSWKHPRRDVWELCSVSSDFWGRDGWPGQTRIESGPEASAPLRVPLLRQVLRCPERRKYCATVAAASPVLRRPLRTLKYATICLLEGFFKSFRPWGHRCFLPFSYSSDMRKMHHLSSNFLL